MQPAFVLRSFNRCDLSKCLQTLQQYNACPKCFTRSWSLLWEQSSNLWSCLQLVPLERMDHNVIHLVLVEVTSQTNRIRHHTTCKFCGKNVCKSKGARTKCLICQHKNKEESVSDSQDFADELHIYCSRFNGVGDTLTSHSVLKEKETALVQQDEAKKGYKPEQTANTYNVNPTPYMTQTLVSSPHKCSEMSRWHRNFVFTSHRSAIVVRLT